MIKYAVFDWDGTLADTYPVLYQAYSLIFSKLNMPLPSLNEIKNITGKLPNNQIFSHLYGSKAEIARPIFYDYITKHHLKGLQMMSGAKEVLDFCLKKGITPLLITNKTGKYIKEELEYLGLEHYFKKIVHAGQTREDKPHPTACRALFDSCLPPSGEIIIIGDGASDVEVAKFYGAKSIIYKSKAKGDYNIDSLSQAIEIMKGL